jgi:tetraacyldisaccharide 4'-kinase
LRALGAIYGRVTTLRRQWYARHPEKRGRLPHPVVSVGNLAVGGSGKTPVVAALARMLLRDGERPAILSRGYGRRSGSEEVVVVSDGISVLTTVNEAGDEPLMLARMLPEVPVVVCARRYRAGELAASRFMVSVMLLDDGFQHLELARDLDLLMVSTPDLDAHLLPSGILREPLGAAKAADAVIVPGSPEDARKVAAVLGVRRAFSAVPRYEPFRDLASGATVAIAPGTTVVAVAGIARPQRFFDALGACDLRVARERAYADHHWFSQRDVSAIERAAREVGATHIVTTEKDATRLGDMARSMAWVCLPQRVALTPEPEFATWMRRRLQTARERL